MLGRWTIGRASGTGVVAGLVALLLWPVGSASNEPLFWLFGAAAALAGLCGLSILVLTVVDMHRRRRGTIMRRMRTFDVVLALLLVFLTLLQLDGWVGRLPA